MSICITPCPTAGSDAPIHWRFGPASDRIHVCPLQRLSLCRLPILQTTSEHAHNDTGKAVSTLTQEWMKPPHTAAASAKCSTRSSAKGASTRPSCLSVSRCGTQYVGSACCCRCEPVTCNQTLCNFQLIACHSAASEWPASYRSVSRFSGRNLAKVNGSSAHFGLSAYQHAAAHSSVQSLLTQKQGS